MECPSPRRYNRNVLESCIYPLQESEPLAILFHLDLLVLVKGFCPVGHVLVEGADTVLYWKTRVVIGGRWLVH